MGLGWMQSLRSKRFRRDCLQGIPTSALFLLDIQHYNTNGGADFKQTIPDFLHIHPCRMQHSGDTSTASAATRTTASSVAQPPPLQESPSQDLITRLNDLLAQHRQPNALPEALHQFLTGALESVLREPLLHWWCDSNLRPVSVELLHLFSLSENSSLQKYKGIIDHTFAMCVQCSEAYVQERRSYLDMYVLN